MVLLRLKKYVRSFFRVFIFVSDGISRFGCLSLEVAAPANLSASVEG